ncbi:unnamed protein product [Lepeophtheirus salmonis]|uniref:(salmon louse) hypothetical protein n=1 Tax=Lepeophtheirus salmonis TaxID=72036 RepID=A0A7R8CC67_LEPSM|nr:unnamed protein product [Lepeophtheirus salmonis]CAF2760444.1 unnamed protein product [Lepeophtheirus salmonis]
MFSFTNLLNIPLGNEEEKGLLSSLTDDLTRDQYINIQDSSPSDSPPSASLNYRSSSNQQEHTSKSFSSQTTTAGLAF